MNSARGHMGDSVGSLPNFTQVHFKPYLYSFASKVEGSDEESPDGGLEILDKPTEISILDQHGFLQYGVPATPDKLLALMNKATLNIGGNIINAQAIEHFILRKPASSSRKEGYRKDDKEVVVRKLYGLESMDPNVIFAVSCGTRSSPAVRIYTGDGVAVELEKAKLDYLQASIVVSGTKRIAFPELLLQNMLDFAADTDSFVEWACQQLPTSGSLRKAMVDCFRGHNPGARISTVLDNIPYDFEFQYLLAI